MKPQCSYFVLLTSNNNIIIKSFNYEKNNITLVGIIEYYLKAFVLNTIKRIFRCIFLVMLYSFSINSNYRDCLTANKGFVRMHVCRMYYLVNIMIIFAITKFGKFCKLAGIKIMLNVSMKPMITFV